MRQPLVQHRNQSVVLTEHVGLPGTRPRLVDHRGNVDPGVVRVGEQQRHHDGIGFGRCQHIAKVGGVLFAERNPHVDVSAHPPYGARELMSRCRGPRVRAAVRRQDECHEACNPHSVFELPAQRPLRGSAPSAGRDVHGAHPIDGYPSNTRGLTKMSLASM